MNVILQGEGRPFGVLEVDSRSEQEFGALDFAFLEGAANILGMAIERERNEQTLKQSEQNLKAALERERVLSKDITHRVKNGLAIVASMLKLQAGAASDRAVTTHLEEAAYRVLAVAKVHQRIQQVSDAGRLDLGPYVRDVCQDLNEAVPLHHIEVATEPCVDVITDRAVLIVLIANELITNATKYAYQDHQRGTIWVRVARGADDVIELSVRDAGRGLPADFDLHSTSGIGLRIIRSLSAQLNGKVEMRRLDPGTEFVLTAPRE